MKLVKILAILIYFSLSFFNTYAEEDIGSITVNVSVPAISNLSANSISPTTVNSGTNTFSATISNDGSVATGSTIRNAFYSQNQANMPAITEHGTNTISALNAGTSATTSLAINLAAGNYFMYVCADQGSSAGGSLIVESNESDNCTSYPVTVNAVSAADLIASTVTPNTATVGSSRTFSSTITNQGNISTQWSFYSFFQVATASGGGGTITDLPAVVTPIIASGGSSVIQSSYTFPSSGTYSVRACADKQDRNTDTTNDAVNESNELNNCSLWLSVVANSLPTANAGSDRAISVPASSVTVNDASSSDSDGTISSNVWSFVSGPSTPTITNGSTLTPTFSNMTSLGTYTFRLTSIDNSGGTATDTMNVVVSSSVFSLTVNTSGTGSGTVSGAGTYAYNTVVTATATAGSGSSFAGWTGDCNSSGQVTMTSNKSCTATFNLNIPSTPTGFSVSPSFCGNNWLNLSWNASAGATNYRVYRGGTLVYNSNGLAFSDTGLTAGVTYSYTITASNVAGTSGSASGSATVSPALCPTGTLTASDCTIASGASSCFANISWSTSNPIGTSQVTTPTNIVAATGDDGAFAYSVSYPSRIFYLYNNSSLLASDSTTASCISGTTWASGICTAISYTVSTSAGVGGTISPSSRTVSSGATTTFTITPNSGYSIASVSGCGGSLSGSTYTTGAITSSCTVSASFTQMTGTLTSSANSCTIPANGSSCNVNLTWQTYSPVATSAVTASGMANYNGNSGTNISFSIPYNSRTFYLYNNGILLAQTPSITSSCQVGYSWDGAKCAVTNTNPSAPTITGPTSVYRNFLELFNITGTDPENNQLIYGIDWDGNGVEDVWTNPYSNSGLTVQMNNSWANIGNYNVRAIAQDINGARSPWSAILPVTVTNAPVAPIITSFNASKNILEFGETVNLSWTSTNATSCTMSSTPTPSVSIASLPNTINNNINFNPTKTTIYTLQCFGPGGSSPQSQRTVNVGKVKPTINEF